MGWADQRAISPNRCLRTLTASLRRLRQFHVLPGAVVTGAVIVTVVWLTTRTISSGFQLPRLLQPQYLALAFLAHAMALMAAALNWHQIIAATVADVGLVRDVRLYVVTLSARRLPGSLWGSVFRTYWYRRLGADWRLAGAASILEVLASTMSGLILVSGGVILFLSPAGPIRLLAWALLGCTVAAIAFSPRLSEIIIHGTLRLMRRPSIEKSPAFDSRTLTAWIALGLVNWVSGGLELSALVRTMTPYDLATLPRLITLWTIAGVAGTMITFLPGGFGVVDITLVGLLSTIFPLPLAVTAALAMRLLTTAFEVFWSLVALVVPPTTRLLRPARDRG